MLSPSVPFMQPGHPQDMGWVSAWRTLQMLSLPQTARNTTTRMKETWKISWWGTGESKTCCFWKPVEKKQTFITSSKILYSVTFDYMQEENVKISWWGKPRNKKNVLLLRICQEKKLTSHPQKAYNVTCLPLTKTKHPETLSEQWWLNIQENSSIWQRTQS